MCTVQITGVYGSVPAGALNPTTLRVIGTLTNCASNLIEVQITAPFNSPQVAAGVLLPPKNSLYVDFQIPATTSLACGATVTRYSR
jgi:hypothetical protein